MTTEKDKATMVSGNNPINDGGLAFPRMGKANYDTPGMTLLDYFAAKAMQAALSAGLRVEREEDVVDQALPALARLSYLTAAAMLRARSNYHDGGS